MLQGESLNVHYGAAHAVQDVSIVIHPEEVVGLVGRNGAGKTTLVYALMGMVPLTDGTLTFADRSMQGLLPYERNRAGLAIVPQGRRIFRDLSVEENLAIVVRGDKGKWNLDRAFDMFPELLRRRQLAAGNLSGGEQQMLAIARALLTNPRLILLDEPFEGLAPSVIHRIAGVLEDLAADGLPALLVEQNLSLVKDLCSRVYVLASGRIVYADTPESFLASPELVKRHLGAMEAPTGEG